MAKENTTDQIRQVRNRVHLAGRVAELTVTEGKTKKDIPYISLEGVIQCGDDAVYDVHFKTFSQAKKANGEDSKAYTNIKEWASKAIPMTKSKENCTWVDMVGSLRCRDFVSREGKLIQGIEYNMTLFNDFKEYACEIDLEGYIAGIKDEVRKNGDDEVETGRKIIRLFSREQIGTAIIDYTRIIVPKEYADQLEDNGFEQGRTATFYITLTPTQNSAPKKAGIGQQRVTEGRAYLEPLMTGADMPIDEDSPEALPTALMKAGMNERKAHLKEIEDAGYQGGSSNNSSSASTTSSNRGGNAFSSTAKKEKEAIEAVDDDGEFPF